MGDTVYALLYISKPQRESSSFSIVTIDGDTITKDATKTLDLELDDDEDSDFDDSDSELAKTVPFDRDAMKQRINKRLGAASVPGGPVSMMQIYTRERIKECGFKNTKAVLYQPDYYALLVSDKTITSGQFVSRKDGTKWTAIPVVEVKTNKVGYLTSITRYARDEKYKIHGRRKGNTFELFRARGCPETPWLYNQLVSLGYEDIHPRTLGDGAYDTCHSEVQGMFDGSIAERLGGTMRYGLVCVDEVLRPYFIHCSEVRFRHLVEALPARYGPELPMHDDHDANLDTTARALWAVSPWLKVSPCRLGMPILGRSLNVIGVVEMGVICLIIPPSQWNPILECWRNDTASLYVNWIEGIDITEEEKKAYHEFNEEARQAESHNLQEKMKQAQVAKEQTIKAREAQAAKHEHELLQEIAAARRTDQQNKKKAEKGSAKTQRKKAKKFKQQQEATEAMQETSDAETEATKVNTAFDETTPANKDAKISVKDEQDGGLFENDSEASTIQDVQLASNTDLQLSVQGVAAYAFEAMPNTGHHDQTTMVVPVLGEPDINSEAAETSKPKQQKKKSAAQAKRKAERERARELEAQSLATLAEGGMQTHMQEAEPLVAEGGHELHEQLEVPAHYGGKLVLPNGHKLACADLVIGAHKVLARFPEWAVQVGVAEWC